MGWIETYIDPENARAYYEGWVAIVDKEKSKKFQALVTISEHIIPLLIWPNKIERRRFWRRIYKLWKSSRLKPTPAFLASTSQTTMTFAKPKSKKMFC